MKKAAIAVAVLPALLISAPARMYADDIGGIFEVVAALVLASTLATETTLKEIGKEKPAKEPAAFVRVNFDNVAQDCARGGGEYLASLGSLLGVSHEHFPAFSKAVQRDFALLFSPGAAHPEMVLHRLTQRAAGQASPSFP